MLQIRSSLLVMCDANVNTEIKQATQDVERRAVVRIQDRLSW
jgi:hypothetical protein